MSNGCSVITLFVLALAGCAEEAPIGLSYGTLTEDHEAGGASGCTEVRDVHRGDVALSSALPRVSRSLRAGAGAVRFDFAAEPVVTDGTSTLTLTATARTEATFCGNECPSSGSDATARFTWRGAVSLPSARGYSVRIDFDAWRESDLGPSRFAGECRIETPWRVPIVIEVGPDARWDDDARCLANGLSRAENCADSLAAAGDMHAVAVAGYVTAGALAAVTATLWWLSRGARPREHVAALCVPALSSAGVVCGASF